MKTLIPNCQRVLLKLPESGIVFGHAVAKTLAKERARVEGAFYR
jgi:hypothetical protein